MSSKFKVLCQRNIPPQGIKHKMWNLLAPTWSEKLNLWKVPKITKGISAEVVTYSSCFMWNNFVRKKFVKFCWVWKFIVKSIRVSKGFKGFGIMGMVHSILSQFFNNLMNDAHPSSNFQLLKLDVWLYVVSRIFETDKICGFNFGFWVPLLILLNFKRLCFKSLIKVETLVMSNVVHFKLFFTNHLSTL